MKIAVVVERQPFYRHMGPIVDEALRRNWAVECWHDYGAASAGPKGYLFPAVSEAPPFRFGRPEFRTYRGETELASLAAGESIDAVFSFRPMPRSVSRGKVRRPVRVSLQDYCDAIYHSGLDGLSTFDLVTMHTEWWIDWTTQYFRAEGYLNGDADDAAAFRRRVKTIGFPELDQRLMIDAADVRRALGLDPGRPVVVLLPFTGAAHPGAFWPNRVFLEPSRARQALNVLRSGRFEHATDVLHGWSDARVVASLRKFCDRHGAALVVKSRRKTPVPGYLEAAADVTLYDESYYPASILQVLCIASLCVSFLSAAGIEAVASGVPHLCLTYSLERYAQGAGIDEQMTLNRLFYDLSEGGLFRFKGASTAMPIPAAIESLADMSLSDFALDCTSRAQYVSRFCGPDDGASSARVLDTVADLCETRA